MKIQTNPNLVVPDGEDWSRVRSPSRAVRRLRHPTTYLIKATDTLVMHPETYAEFRRSQLINDMAREHDRDRLAAMMGRPLP